MMSTNDDGEMGRHPAYIAIMLMLCVIAIALNVLVVAVVMKSSGASSSIDIFITNLAASDIVHAGIVLPVHFYNVFQNHENFSGSNTTCKLMMMLPLISVMAAILTIVVIAIDRYRAIIKNKLLYRKGALITVAIIWIASFVFSSPQIYEYSVYTEFHEDVNMTYTSCGSEGIPENFETIYASLVFVFAYLIPLCLLILCYSKVVVFIWNRAKPLTGTNTSSGRIPSISVVGITLRTGNHITVTRTGNHITVTRRNVKVLHMLITVTVTFALFWAPYFILFALTEITGLDDTSSISEWPHVIGRLMTLLSTISNPAFCIVFSTKFKTIALDLLGCKCHVTRWRSNRVTPWSNNQSQERAVTEHTVGM